MKTKPDLGIKDPYALDQAQFDASVELLKQQKTLVGKYWGTAQEEIDGFANGDMAIGTAWLYQQNTINAGTGKKVASVTPKEGATGWSDTWMISSKAAHPNCMYKWMDYIISPEGQRRRDGLLRRGAGQRRRRASRPTSRRPAGATSSTPTTRRTSRTSTTGTRRRRTCLDGRGPICTDFDAWTQAWTEVTGG